jgi:hypothetical protein
MLNQTIRELIQLANRQPGVPAQKRLAGGLAIAIKTSGGELWLKLQRDGKPPSATEWGTVIKHWPEPAELPAVTPAPTSYKSGKTYALVAHWRPVAPVMFPIAEQEQEVIE